VVADIARLGEQIADHIRRMQEATACIAAIDRQITELRDQRRDAYNAYMEVYSANYADMQIKQADLDVFDFLIKTTKKMCDEQTSLVQVGQESMQLCENSMGGTIRFTDIALQSKFDRLLMKGTKDLLRNALMGTQEHKALSFFQQPMGKATAKVPVISGQSGESGALKCGPIPDCGLLYDTLSLEWEGTKIKSTN